MKNLIIVISLLLSFSTQATLMSISLDKTSYQVNDTITAQLVISDLSYILGGFDAEVNFDPSMLGLTGWSFGTGFDDGIVGSIADGDDLFPGALILAEYTEPNADANILAQRQGNGFVFATFTFSALSAGPMEIFLMDGLLVSLDNMFDEGFSGTSSIVNVTSVPEPASALLLLSSLLLIRTRFSKK